MQTPCSIGIFVFDTIEVLDFAGPYEVFTTASRVNKRLQQTLADSFHVSIIGQYPVPIRARAGLVVTPDFSFSDHPALDVLIVPGGVVTQELAKPDVIDWIKTVANTAKITASVCTGAFLLAKASLLEGKSATTHWEDIDEFRAVFPNINVLSGLRWVDEGSLITSAGISAGIDMSLHLVERIAGRDLALKTAHQMDFDWTGNT